MNRLNSWTRRRDTATGRRPLTLVVLALAAVVLNPVSTAGGSAGGRAPGVTETSPGNASDASSTSTSRSLPVTSVIPAVPATTQQAESVGGTSPTVAAYGSGESGDGAGVATAAEPGPCPNGSCVSLQPTTPGTQEAGHVNISGLGLFGSAVGVGTASPAGMLTITAPTSGEPVSLVELQNAAGATLGFFGLDAAGVPVMSIGSKSFDERLLVEGGTVDYVLAEFRSSYPRTGININNQGVGGKQWVLAASDGSGSGFSAGGLTVRNGSENRSLATFMPSGNVGIGTNNPQKKLHVADELQVGTTWGNIFLGPDTGNNQVLIQRFGNDFRLYTANRPRFTVANSGNVGIGVTAPTSRLDVYHDTAATNVDLFRLLSNVGGTGNVKLRVDSSGNLFTDGSTVMGTPADVAERFEADGSLESGEVVSFTNGRLRRATSPYEERLAGVVSTKPGVILAGNTKGAPLALVGRVPVRVTTENGPISAGDALTSSSRPGYAMKATERGRVLGFALSPFDGQPGSTGADVGTVDLFVNPHDWWGGTDAEGYGEGGKRGPDDSVDASTDGAVTLVAGQGSVRVSLGTRARPPTSVTANADYDTNVYVTDMAADGFTLRVGRQSNSEQKIFWRCTC